MKADLHNLVTAEEAYFSDNNSVYAGSTANLGTNYHPSTGVTVTITLGGGSTDEGNPLCQ